jgi:hypothetical protein
VLTRPRNIAMAARLALGSVAALSAVTFAAGPASADISNGGTPLPVSNVSAFVADANSGYLLYGTGAAKQGLLISNYDVSFTKKLIPKASVDDISLSADGRSAFAASESTNTIYQVSMTTLAVTKKFVLPAGDCPDSVAAVSDRYVAVGFTCDAQWGGVGVLDLKTGTLAPEGGTDQYYQPMVRNVPNTSQFLAVDTGLSVSRATLFDAASGTPVQLGGGDYLLPCEGVDDLSMNPDGRTFALACLGSAAEEEFSLADFSQTASIDTTAGATSVAFTTDGSYLAAGMLGIYDNDVALFHHSATDTSQVYAADFTDTGTGYPTTTVPRGVAFASGQTVFYALAGDGVGDVWLYTTPGAPTVIYPPTSTVTAAAPATAGVGTSVAVTGTLRFADTASVAAAAGKRVSVARTLNGVTSTAVVVTDATGSFTSSFRPMSLGTATFTVSYAGDRLHSASTAGATTQVVLNAAKVTVSVAAPKCTTGSVVAHLGATYTNRTLVIEQDGVPIASGPVDAAGYLRTGNRSGGHHSFAALFDGDARYAPGQADITVC